MPERINFPRAWKIFRRTISFSIVFVTFTSCAVSSGGFSSEQKVRIPHTNILVSLPTSWLNARLSSSNISLLIFDKHYNSSISFMPIHLLGKQKNFSLSEIANYEKTLSEMLGNKTVGKPKEMKLDAKRFFIFKFITPDKQYGSVAIFQTHGYLLRAKFLTKTKNAKAEKVFLSIIKEISES